ncbi:hypothetical protein PoB_005178800 [Plakobranchus ocellatus]|uniref:Uncharacterized protein n=1 Tax=Plakobranchus ocellatus TaxID=259542 RepID=A0AAV4C071_9GAST|nr:hypothetical protein PoB_005178800 [Plakobranchus ocellatus]
MGRHYEDAFWDDEPANNPDPRRDDACERDGPRGGLCRRPVGPHSNLGRPRDEFEGAFQEGTAGELHRETDKVRAWGKDDRLLWSMAWGESDRFSGAEDRQSSGCAKALNQEGQEVGAILG